MTKIQNFGDVLTTSEAILLMDGAMGTELMARGWTPAPGQYCTDWNQTHPDEVQAIHRAYVQAGAQVLLTNTFPILEMACSGHLVGEAIHAVCAGSVALAQSAGPESWVLADLGDPTYFGAWPTPAMLAEVIHGFREADGILLETFSGPKAVDQAGVLVQQIAKPVILSLCGMARDRRPDLAAIARRAERVGLAGLGVNCGQEISPAACAEMIRVFARETDLPLVARPNAGSPEARKSPDEFGQEMKTVMEAGVRLMGGCCGTTPAHIAALARLIPSARH